METLVFTPHYEITPIHPEIQGYKNTECKIDEIKKFFNDETIMDLNWLFLSTSGVHGSYITLDEIEKGWNETCGDDCYDESHIHAGRKITFVIVCPRTCVIRYGNVNLESLDDIQYLRLYMNKTIEAVIRTQKENL